MITLLAWFILTPAQCWSEYSAFAQGNWSANVIRAACNTVYADPPGADAAFFECILDGAEDVRSETAFRIMVGRCRSENPKTNVFDGFG